jgi:pimeloyl-ACP methyl ester carboxylesterase
LSKSYDVLYIEANKHKEQFFVWYLGNVGLIKMKRNIYCISGLGADERLFQNLDIQEANLIYVNWVPYDVKDDLMSYAYKLSQQIKEERPVLMGVSFGGMLAIEIAKLLKARKVFIVSSIKNTGDFPAHYILANRLRIIPLIPSYFINQPSLLIDYFFGAKTQKDKELLHDYLRRSDARYIKWALQAILSWKNKDDNVPVVHIHGTKDKVLPLPRTVMYKLKDAGHLMIFNRASEVSSILKKELEALKT